LSRHPTVNQVKELCDTMRRLDWRSLADRLNTAIERDKRGGDMQPDGYPASTMNGGSGDSELTSVEAAVEARLQGRVDRYRDNVDEACSHLLELVNHAGALRHRLDNLDDLVSDKDRNAKAPRTCGACTAFRRTPSPVAHTGTVGDRLTMSVSLCEDCYEAVRQTAKPGSRAGVLPTAEQVRWHDDHGRWRLRAG
jgi:hypothetical protein